MFSAENLFWNIISFGKIEEVGCKLRYDREKRYVLRRSDGCKIVDVHNDTNIVLVVQFVEADETEADDCLATAVYETLSALHPDVQSGSLLYFIFVLLTFHTT